MTTKDPITFTKDHPIDRPACPGVDAPSGIHTTQSITCLPGPAAMGLPVNDWSHSNPVRPPAQKPGRKNLNTRRSVEARTHTTDFQALDQPDLTPSLPLPQDNPTDEGWETDFDSALQVPMGFQAPPSTFELLSRLERPKPSEAYPTYWYFACERQKIFFNRLRGHTPLTADPIFQVYKFTNTYRASDRVSQHLIREVIYQGEWSIQDTLFRTLLFKIFNKIETWEHLKGELGEITAADFKVGAYDALLTRRMKDGHKIFSGAYIMPSGGSLSPHARKHTHYLDLLQRMLDDDLPQKIVDCKKFEQVYHLVLSYPMIGPFLAYQYAIDINYSTLTDFSESDWVRAGPGAQDGISKCFLDPGGFTNEELIEWMTDHQEQEFERYGLTFPSLWGRPMQLIDCQNVFCEVSKYTRMSHPHLGGLSGRTRIKQSYQPKPSLAFPFYPPKWGINAHILEDLNANLPRKNRQ